MKSFITLFIFLCLILIGPTPSTVSAQAKNTSGSYPAEEYGAYATTVVLHLLRAFTDVKFGTVNYDSDLSTGSVSDLKFGTDVGNFYFGEVILGSIGSNLLKPRQLDGRIVTGGQIEISNFKFTPFDEGFPFEIIEQAGDLGFSEIKGDCLIHYEYDWGNSNISLSTVFRLQNGGEIHIATEIQDLSLNLSSEIFGLGQTVKPSVTMDKMGNNASAKIKFLKITFYDDGLVKKGIELYAQEQSMSPHQAERALLSQIDVFSSPLKKKLPASLQTKINKLVLEDLPVFFKNPQIIGLSLAPDVPISFHDLEILFDKMELETLNVNVFVNKTGLRKRKTSPTGTAQNKNKSVMDLMAGTGTPQHFFKAAQIIGSNPDLKNAELLFYLAKLHSSFADGISRKQDFPKAYRYALLSSASGYSPAVPLLKLIERKIPIKEIRRVQQQTFNTWKTRVQSKTFQNTHRKAMLGRLPSIRKLARGFWHGRTMPRNFLRAYAWANIGAARGDMIMRALRDRILSVVETNRFLSPQDLKKAQDLSLEIWNQMAKN